MLIFVIWIVTILLNFITNIELLYPKNKSILFFKRFKRKLPSQLFTYVILIGVQSLITGIALIYSQRLLVPLKESTLKKIEDPIIVLIIICIVSLIMSLSTFIFKFLVGTIYVVNSSINFLKQSISNKEQILYIFVVVLGIMIIIIAPNFMFSFIYSMMQPFVSITSPSSAERLDNLSIFDIFYYSINISYPVPENSHLTAIHNMMKDIKGVKVITSIQIITKQLLDIFLLGYFASAITQVIQRKKQ